MLFPDATVLAEVSQSIWCCFHHNKLLCSVVLNVVGGQFLGQMGLYPMKYYRDMVFSFFLNLKVIKSI